MLFQCWTEADEVVEPELKYNFMFTEDGFSFDEGDDSMLINQEFEGFDEEIEEYED